MPSVIYFIFLLAILQRIETSKQSSNSSSSFYWCLNFPIVPGYLLLAQSMAICWGVWKGCPQLQPGSRRSPHLYFQYWVLPQLAECGWQPFSSVRWHQTQTNWVGCLQLFSQASVELIFSSMVCSPSFHWSFFDFNLAVLVNGEESIIAALQPFLQQQYSPTKEIRISAVVLSTLASAPLRFMIFCGKYYF